MRLKHAHKVTGAKGINLYAETDVAKTFARIRRAQAAAMKAEEAMRAETEIKVKPIGKRRSAGS